jgi:pSer/pThr/pTyr-binding forkhead associated (FHA) protein
MSQKVKTFHDNNDTHTHTHTTHTHTHTQHTMQHSLTVVHGAVQFLDQVFQLNTNRWTRIGSARYSSDIVPDTTVSKVHVLVRPVVDANGAHLQVVDVSTHGTFINGLRSDRGILFTLNSGGKLSLQASSDIVELVYRASATESESVPDSELEPESGIIQFVDSEMTASDKDDVIIVDDEHDDAEHDTQYVLEYLDGDASYTPTVLVGGRDYLLGRDEATCDVTVAGANVSRAHCLLLLRDSQILVQDLGQHGTYTLQEDMNTRATKLERPVPTPIRVGTMLLFPDYTSHNERQHTRYRFTALSKRAPVSVLLQLGVNLKAHEFDWIESEDREHLQRVLSMPEHKLEEADRKWMQFHRVVSTNAVVEAKVDTATTVQSDIKQCDDTDTHADADAAAVGTSIRDDGTLAIWFDEESKHPQSDIGIFATILQSARRLRIFRLSGDPLAPWTGKCLTALQHCKNIHTICLSRVPTNFTFDSLLSLPAQLRSLSLLNFDGLLDDIQEHVAKLISTRDEKLATLVQTSVPNYARATAPFKDFVGRVISHRFKHLEELDLSYTRVADESIRNLSCPHLKALLLEGCVHVFGEALIITAKRNPSLVFIDVNHSSVQDWRRKAFCADFSGVTVPSLYHRRNEQRVAFLDCASRYCYTHHSMGERSVLHIIFSYLGDAGY